MSLLFRRQEAPESRAITSVPWSAGVSVRSATDRAMRLAPVYGAVSLIADALSSLPWHGYRDGPTGKVPMAQDPPIVRDPGGGFVDRASWLSQYVASVLLRGNAYGFMVTGSRCLWLHPDRVQVRPGTGITSPPVYLLDGAELPPLSVLHVRGVTMPGDVYGLSPIALFASQIEVGEATVDYARTWFRRGAVPSALFTNGKATISAEQAQTVKTRLVASVRAGEPLVMGSDWSYQALSVSPKDAQFVETAKLTANTIATIFHVAPEEIGGEAGSSLTYSTLEMNEIKFIRHAVMPWTSRLEQAISRRLPAPQYARFNLDAYVRADLMTRMQAHEIGLRTGVETQTEARALEDRPPLTPEEQQFWADHYRGTAPIGGQLVARTA